eukprot:g6117.t1
MPCQQALDNYSFQAGFYLNPSGQLVHSLSHDSLRTESPKDKDFPVLGRLSQFGRIFPVWGGFSSLGKFYRFGKFS